MAIPCELSISSAKKLLVAPVKTEKTEYTWNFRNFNPSSKEEVLDRASRMIGRAFEKLDKLKQKGMSYQDHRYQDKKKLVQILFQRKVLIEQAWKAPQDVRTKA